MSSRSVGVAFLLLVVVVSPAVGLVASSPSDGTVTGPLMPLPGDTEAEYKQYVEEAARNYGYEPRGEISALYKDGVTYLVSSSTEPGPGVAEVRGSVVEPYELGNSQYGVIFADGVSVSQSGPRVSVSELVQNPDQYSGQVVETDAHYREATFLTDTGGLQTFVRVGDLTTRQGDFPIDSRPGQAARWMAVNLSENRDSKFGQISKTAETMGIGSQNSESVTLGLKPTSFWADGQGTVTVLVLPESMAIAGSVRYYPISVDVEERTTVSPAELQARGDELEGDIVTVHGRAAGSQLSAQETLLAAAKCAPDSITVPGVGCIPIPTDVSIHTGAVASAGSPESAVPYAALSNQHQDVPVTDERGEYRLTGRVVSTDQLDPRLPDGYGLIVYERERVGDLSGGASGQLENAASDVTDTFRSQLTMSSSEYEEKYGGRNGRPVTETATTTTTEGSAGGPDPGGSSDPGGQNTPIVRTDEQQASETPAKSNIPFPPLSSVAVVMLGLGIFLICSAGVAAAIMGFKESRGRELNERHETQNKWVAITGFALTFLGALFISEMGVLLVGGLGVIAAWVAGWKYVIGQF